MTMQPRFILKTLVLAGLVLHPLASTAQTSRPASAPAPAPTRAAAPTTPAPRAAAQSPNGTSSTAPAPAPVGTTGTTSATGTSTAPAPATPPAARATAAVATTRGSENDYRLGPGDKLRIEVYHEPQISQSLQVRPDGKITLPLVGDLGAAGHTSIELRDALTSSLKEYITNPVVTVIVQEAQANQIFVIGEVANPGTQVLQGQLTALQALAQAGGLKEFAKAGDIRILRKTPGGTTQTIKFDYKGALKGTVEPMVLRPGDTVVVP
jgi:polysaccharide export outer membrane protein